MGDLCREAGRLRDAVFWYKLALDVGPTRGVGFADPDCGGFLPCLWLCVCYDRLGERERARSWNEQAARYRPQDASVLQNRAYFARALPDGNG